MGFGCVFTIPSMELLLLLKASMRVCTMPFLWVIKKKKIYAVYCFGERRLLNEYILYFYCYYSFLGIHPSV